MIVQCVKCGGDIVVSCADAQYLDWKENHRLIQNAMPDVPRAEREMLLSGYCDACFERLFPNEDD